MKYKIPETFMGKPIEGAIERALAKAPPPLPSEGGTSSGQDVSDFIYVPSISLYVAKEKTFHGKNWHDSHRELHKQNQRMPTIPEFREFLKYIKSQPANQEYQNIFNEITEIKSPWRSEWLDASFKVQGDNLHINYNHLVDSNGNLIQQKSEILDRETLMQDKSPGISLDDWLENNYTNQGLPKQNISDGSLYYWCPVDKRVARFYAGSGRAGLGCYRYPSGTSSALGVRAVALATDLIK